MRQKIRYDGESEKFCKIFWELNKAWKRGDMDTHACVAVARASNRRNPPRPATHRPWKPTCVSADRPRLGARATTPAAARGLAAPADGQRGRRSGLRCVSRQSPVDARQDSAWRRRHAGGPRTTSRRRASVLAPAFWQFLLHGEVGRAAQGKQAAEGGRTVKRRDGSVVSETEKSRAGVPSTSVSR